MDNPAGCACPGTLPQVAHPGLRPLKTMQMTHYAAGDFINIKSHMKPDQILLIQYCNHKCTVALISCWPHHQLQIHPVLKDIAREGINQPAVVMFVLCLWPGFDSETFVCFDLIHSCWHLFRLYDLHIRIFAKNNVTWRVWWKCFEHQSPRLRLQRIYSAKQR